MWWLDDLSESYWLEITGRDDVGERLWHYREVATAVRLMEVMRQGDTVLHYWKPAKAIVGRSTVASAQARYATHDGDDSVARTIADYIEFDDSIELGNCVHRATRCGQFTVGSSETTAIRCTSPSTGIVET